MPFTAREILAHLEAVLNSHRLAPVPSFDSEQLKPDSIADGSYSISPGPAQTRLVKGYHDGERTFRIDVLFRSAPHGEWWKTPNMLDREEALTQSLLALSYADTLEADYSPDSGKRFVVLSYTLTTRLERDDV